MPNEDEFWLCTSKKRTKKKTDHAPIRMQKTMYLGNFRQLS